MRRYLPNDGFELFCFILAVLFLSLLGLGVVELFKLAVHHW